MGNYQGIAFCPRCSRLHQLNWIDYGRDGFKVRCTVTDPPTEWAEDDWEDEVKKIRQQMIPPRTYEGVKK